MACLPPRLSGRRRHRQQTPIPLEARPPSPEQCLRRAAEKQGLCQTPPCRLAPTPPPPSRAQTLDASHANVAGDGWPTRNGGPLPPPHRPQQIPKERRVGGSRPSPTRRRRRRRDVPLATKVKSRRRWRRRSPQIQQGRAKAVRPTGRMPLNAQSQSRDDVAAVADAECTKNTGDTACGRRGAARRLSPAAEPPTRCNQQRAALRRRW